MIKWSWWKNNKQLLSFSRSSRELDQQNSHIQEIAQASMSQERPNSSCDKYFTLELARDTSHIVDSNTVPVNHKLNNQTTCVTFQVRTQGGWESENSVWPPNTAWTHSCQHNQCMKKEIKSLTANGTEIMLQAKRLTEPTKEHSVCCVRSYVHCVLI